MRALGVNQNIKFVGQKIKTFNLQALKSFYSLKEKSEFYILSNAFHITDSH